MSKKLTWEQKIIVSHGAGHALVKAVPGSGKTTTLVMRVKQLINMGTNPKTILILMYNKSAQKSFTAKLKAALNPSNDTNVRIPDVRTFHSLALTIIRDGERKGLINRKTLLTPDDFRYGKIVKDAYRYGFGRDEDFIPANDIEEFELFITRCRASDVSPSDAINDPIFSDTKPESIRAYGRYCELLDENNLRTFDDCLSEAVTLLRKHKAFGDGIKHIVVDEYQDVNLVQHEMIRSLAQQDTSVMAVGDINQCIYEWRGARPDFINGLFEKHYPGTQVFQLSCTFRFGHELSLMANSVIRRNSTKLTKLCVSHPGTPKTEVKLHFDECLSTVISNFSARNGTRAILSRTNANLAEAEIALRLCKLPYRYLDGSSSLHKRPEFGLLIVLFLIAVYGDLRLIENHPGKQAIIQGFLRKAGFSWKKGQLHAALKGLMATNADALNLLGEILESDQNQSRKLQSISNTRKTYTEETPAVDVLARLKRDNVISRFDYRGVTRIGSNDQDRGIEMIERLLKSNKIDSRTFLELMLFQEDYSSNGEPFTLSTLHSSKGLEWDTVMMIGLEDKEFPCGSSESLLSHTPVDTTTNEKNIEEERRLFYVGITRTKRQLHLVTPVDKRLYQWLENRWDTTPKRPTATRFVYEAGKTACSITSDAIYSNSVDSIRNKISGFHQRYLGDLQRLKV